MKKHGICEIISSRDDEITHYHTVKDDNEKLSRDLLQQKC